MGSEGDCLDNAIAESFFTTPPSPAPLDADVTASPSGATRLKAVERAR
jgi:hypothetical protein